MTNTDYIIAIEPSRHLMRIKQAGFWTVETTERFARDYNDAVRKVASASGDMVLILDQRDLDVQSTQVMHMLAALVATSRPAPRKVALIGVKAMVRMQGKRIDTDSDKQWFENEAKAYEWLFPEASAAD